MQVGFGEHRNGQSYDCPSIAARVASMLRAVVACRTGSLTTAPPLRPARTGQLELELVGTGSLTTAPPLRLYAGHVVAGGLEERAVLRLPLHCGAYELRADPDGAVVNGQSYDCPSIAAASSLWAGP